MRPGKELFEYVRSGRPERRVRNPCIFTANLRLEFPEPRWWRTENGEVGVNEHLGVDADRRGGVACEHDEIVDPLCAFSTGAQFVGRLACPIRAPLLIVVTSSVVDRVVKPEADLHLGRMLRQRDDRLDLLEAFGEVLRRVVVAMWLGVATQNVFIEA